MNDIIFPAKLYDVNFWEYTPKRPILNSDFPSSKLLFQSFLNENKKQSYIENAYKIQSYAGLGKTVWGYKKDKLGSGSWEYYFYLYKQNPEFEVNKLIHNVGNTFLNFVPDTFTVKDYYLVSFDIGDNKTDHLNVYFPDLKHATSRIYINQSEHYFDQDNPHVYLLKFGKSSVPQKSNYYYGFYPWPIDKKEIDKKIMQASSHLYQKEFNFFLDYTELPFLKKTSSEVYLPISVAVKEKAIGLYFIDIGIENFIEFLNYFKYPKAFIEHVIDYQKKYDYLKFDISFDMVMNHDKLDITKGAFYGTL